MLTLYINNTKVDYKKLVFKGGEVHVKLPASNLEEGMETAKRVAILAHLRSSNDIMELLLLTDAIRRRYGNTSISLGMPYIPYARQDRVCDAGESLSMKVFADLINSQNYEAVHVWDPHSDVSTALLNNVVVTKAQKFVEKILDFPFIKKDNLVLVSPDAGANKKIMEVAQYIRVENVVRADKTRNPKDGSITGTVVYSQPVGSKDFLIVDDLIDGGRTFIELAKVLKPLTTGKVYLYVTHGIFSAGVDGLKEHISHVFTANPFIDLTPVSGFVTQVSL